MLLALYSLKKNNHKPINQNNQKEGVKLIFKIIAIQNNSSNNLNKTHKKKVKNQVKYNLNKMNKRNKDLFL